MRCAKLGLPPYRRGLLRGRASRQRVLPAVDAGTGTWEGTSLFASHSLTGVQAQLWSPEDEQERTKQLVQLEAEIAAGRCVVFIGAGPSAGAGYPKWEELISNLAAAAGMVVPTGLLDDRGDAVLHFAEECRVAIGEQRYLALLRAQFHPLGKHQFLPIHSHLVKIPFNAFITTNFDTCLENAADDAARDTPTRVHCYPYCEVGCLRRREVRDIYHIHGQAYDQHGQSTVKSIVLTERDYGQAYDKAHSQIRRLLSEVLVYYTVLFIGVSLRDPALQGVLKASQEEAHDLATIAARSGQAAPPSRTHFALQPVILSTREAAVEEYTRDREAELLDDRPQLGAGSMSTIRYVKEDQLHSGLTALMKRLRDETGIPSGGLLYDEWSRVGREP